MGDRSWHRKMEEFGICRSRARRVDLTLLGALLGLLPRLASIGSTRGMDGIQPIASGLPWHRKAGIDEISALQPGCGARPQSLKFRVYGYTKIEHDTVARRAARRRQLGGRRRLGGRDTVGAGLCGRRSGRGRPAERRQPESKGPRGMSRRRTETTGRQPVPSALGVPPIPPRETIQSSTLREIGMSMNPEKRAVWERTRNAVRQHYFVLSSFLKPAILRVNLLRRLAISTKNGF